MSGFVVLLEPKGMEPDRGLLERLTGAMSNRGPDGSQFWRAGQVGFGLAWLRTAAGAADRPPLASLDRETWIVGDIRVDGRQALVASLRALGRSELSSASDAELVLHAFAAWGDDCLQHLIGDFSFAIWDAPRERLFCAHDHFGVRPLFKARLGETWIVGNSLDAFRQHPGFTGALNDAALAEFLMFEAVFDPEATAFSEVSRLPPAHCLEIVAGAARIARFWRLPEQIPIVEGRKDTVEQFRALFTEAVQDRVRDASVGIEMSGGLDSTSIAAIVTGAGGEAPMSSDVRAYTFVHDPLIPDRERDFAELAAGGLGLPVEFIQAADSGLYDRANEGFSGSPAPMHSPQLAMNLDCLERASRNHRVMLTGCDGDALLAESPKPYLRSLWRGGRRGKALLSAMSYAATERRILPHAWMAPFRARQVLGDDVFPAWIHPDLVRRLGLRLRWEEVQAEGPPSDPVRPYARRVLSYFERYSFMFDAYDAGVHGFPMEYRHPFMDVRLVAFCLTLPPWPWCAGKHLLRKAMKNRLPETIRVRRKTTLAGYPHVPLLRRSGAEWVDSVVASPALERYVDPKAVPPLFGASDPDRSWIDLRPISLHFWLSRAQSQRTRSTT